MSKYSKGQKVSYRGPSNYVGKNANHADSNGVVHSSTSKSGTITSVQNNTVRIDTGEGRSETVHKNRVN